MPKRDRLAGGMVLIYDGRCGVCTAFARLFLLLSRDLSVLPLQLPKARDLLRDMDEDAINGSAHLVLPRGEVLSGVEALSRLMDTLPIAGSLHRALSRSNIVRRFELSLYRLGLGLRGWTSCGGLRRSSS